MNSFQRPIGYLDIMSVLWEKHINWRENTSMCAHVQAQTHGLLTTVQKKAFYPSVGEKPHHQREKTVKYYTHRLFIWSYN